VSALTAQQLGKRYGRRWALRNCTLEIPEGRIVGLVGANGAGKTTLMQLAVGLIAPSEGTIAVCGDVPAKDATQLGRVGYLAQDAPVYASLSVADHLRMGEACNPRWDRELACDRVTRLGLPLAQAAGRLSGGQRAQLALTLAISKRPEVVVLDEPVASLDPLARREFLQDLMVLAADQAPTVVLSSHSLADVERVCDHLVVVAAGSVWLDGDVDELLASHKVLTGPRRDARTISSGQTVITEHHTERQSTMLVRTTAPVLDPAWRVADVGLEELVLSYMSAAPESADPRPLTMVRS
jgi:ABC-2 type transport system ATP-binding protein